jgi:hypothetical protein
MACIGGPEQSKRVRLYFYKHIAFNNPVMNMNIRLL